MNFSSVGKNIKRYLSILLVTTVVLVGFPLSVYAGDPGTDLWTAKVTTKPDGYQEDDDGDVTISTAEGLAWLSKVVNGLDGVEADNFEGRTVTLAADIALEGHLWNPIGREASGGDFPFKGTFDGCGYKITNMKVDVSTNSGSLCAGLFGLVEAGVEGKGIVKNIIVSGEVKSTGVGNSYTGGIVGRSKGGAVRNSSFVGDVTAKYVSSNSTSRNNFAGGILGHSLEGEVSNCSFKGAVTAEGYVQNFAGGIVGSNFTSSVSNCSSKGIITASGGGTPVK